MKIRLVVALVGLTISAALPTFAQQKDVVVDPQIIQKIHAVGKAYDEGENNNDPAAIAALFTEDGVFVTTTGQVNGRQAIENWYKDLFQQWHPKNHLTKFDGNVVHVIGPGDALWATGEWSDTGQGQTGSPIEAKGYWGSTVTRS